MFEVGTIIAGKFRIERILGQGGMGIVAVATHLQLEQRVAIKVMREQLTTDGTIVERFLREAQASAKLRSDHVCRVTDVGQLDNGAPYIVMELLEGSDLASVINRGALPIATAVEYVLQACIAIAEAHVHGIIHRDLKPANLFLTKQLDDTPLVKVLDFGIAKAASKSDHALTQTEALMGSPGYMSPEQLRSARDVDARTDVWALGVILYQLVAGRVPFPADSITELAVKVAMDPPDPLDVDPAFRAVVFRCLEKPPADRYPDVAALARALLPFGGPRGAEHLALIERIARSRAAPDAMASTLAAAGSAKSIDPMAKTAASIVYGETAAASIPPTTTLQGAAGHAETKKAPRSRGWIGALAIAVAASTITVVVTRDNSAPSTSAGPQPAGSAAVDPAKLAKLRAQLDEAVGKMRCGEANEISGELYRLANDLEAIKKSSACMQQRVEVFKNMADPSAAAVLLAQAEEDLEQGKSSEVRNLVNVALNMSGSSPAMRALAIKVACKDKDLDTARITFAGLESIELRSEASAYCAALGIALVPDAQPQVTTGKPAAPPKPRPTPSKAADPIPADWSRHAGNAMMSGDYKGARDIVLAVLAKEPNNEHAAYVATGAYCMLDDAVNAKKWAAKLSDEMRAKAARFSCSKVKIDIGIDWVKYEREKDAKEKAAKAEPSTDNTDADRTAAPTNERLDLLQEARAANQSGNWTLSLELAEQILADRPTDRAAAHIATVAACRLKKPVLAKKYAAILTPEKRRELQRYVCHTPQIDLE